MKSTQLKVLVFDIETAPIEAFVWDLHVYSQYIPLIQMKKDWHILAWSAKWLGDPPSKLIYRDQRKAKNIADDKELLKGMWHLLNEAEIVLTKNGEKFDVKKLNARFILNGMLPPKPYKHIDTEKIARRVASFTSNSLDYLTDKLCVRYKKLTHKKFPGFVLWRECLARNNAAWEEMRKYNNHDVLSTEELYLKIRAWAPENVPKVYQVTDKAGQCSTCGFIGPMRKGKPRLVKKGVYQQHLCPSCGSWQKGEVIKNKCVFISKAA